MAGHVVKVSVVAETKKFQRAFKGLAKETGLSNLAQAGKKAVGVLATATAAGAAAAGALGTKVTLMAADLEQSTGAIEAVFKNTADQMKGFADTAATTVGLTKNEYQELGTLLGAQLKNGGTAMKDLAGKTNDLIGLGADMSAMFGGTTADAVGALSSALKGERDPIERYGVTLKQAMIDAKAAQLGFSDVSSTSAQQAATLALIMEQTADAHGAFARENDTLSHQLQVLKARFQDTATEIGTALLPYATAAAKYIGENFLPILDQAAKYLTGTLIPAFQNFAAGVAENVAPKLKVVKDVFETTILPALQKVASWIKNTAPPIFNSLVDLVKNWGPAIAGATAVIIAFIKGFQAFNTIKTVITLVKTAFVALNAVMAANPIILVAAAVAALAAGFIALYQHSETFRNAVQAAWAGIQQAAQVVADWFTTSFLPAFQGVWNALIPVVQLVWTILQTAWTNVGQPIATFIISVFQGVAANWQAIWGGIQTAFQGVWTVISTVVTTAMGIIQGIIQTVTALISGDWSGVWAGIQQIASSVWNGIQGIISGVITFIQGIISTALNVIKGIWTGAWNGIGSFLTGAWNRISNAVTTGVGNAITIIKGLPGKALAALGNLGKTLWNAGTQLIQGFIDGITNMIGNVKNTLSDLTSKLTSWKGPEDKDRRLLTPAGEMVINGFIKGLENRYAAVRSSLRSLTRDVAGTQFDPLSAPALNAPALAGIAASGRPIHVTVNLQTLTPTPELARQVAGMIEDWWRLNGRTR
ncbi:hypothetical protein [Schaalia sp. ZJ1691]|uniref:phage tail protein n=1 Tax=Schaalia sp. ZJ1691 TaxID=2709404 RepID=UPI0013E9DED9|nr:hypothetical protein [Schaalia sp. ZJ1691]